MSARERPRVLTAWLDPAYVILVAAIAMLGWMNFGLRADRAALTRQLRATVPGLTGQHESEVGDVVPSFAGATAAGKPAAVAYAGWDRSLLLVYDPRCGVCMSEVPLWKSLAAEAAALGVAVRWISLAPADLTQKGIERDGLDADPIIMPDSGMQRAYRVASVPHVLVVSEAGRVVWAHHGALSAGRQEDVRHALEGSPVSP